MRKRQIQVLPKCVIITNDNYTGPRPAKVIGADQGPPLKALYESSYPPNIKRAGLTNVELLTDFPVTTLAFGFTRDGRDPAETTLVPFRDRERGTIRVYGLQAHTEALFFQFDPLQVLDHLKTGLRDSERARRQNRKGRVAEGRTDTAP